MLDFGALPPEINSARIYSGPGSAPMLATAAAWDAIAAQLCLYAAGYSSTLSELQGQWTGLSSMAMASTIAPYVDWATTTASQAEQVAGQARAAAAAYETAFAMTVPPPAVAANRMQLAILVATNFVGQNTPAIAATEAEYAEMWAQDAAAMYCYAASSAAASTLTPFNHPPQTTNTGGQSAQAVAVTQATSTSTGQTQAILASQASPNASLADPSAASASNASSSSSSSSSALTAFNGFDTLVVGPAQPFWSVPYAVFSAGQFGTGLNLAGAQGSTAAAAATASTADAVAPKGIRGPVLAGLGKAAPVGKLSVPQGWVTANPGGSSANGPVTLAGKDIRAAPVAQAHPASDHVGGIPAARAGDKAADVPVLRNGRRVFKMPRPAHGG